VTKFVRFDEDHFALLIDTSLAMDKARHMSAMFAEAWPGKKLLVVAADDFVDLTGQYELLPIPEEVRA